MFKFPKFFVTCKWGTWCLMGDKFVTYTKQISEAWYNACILIWCEYFLECNIKGAHFENECSITNNNYTTNEGWWQYPT